ncbi:glycoside hydrolase family 3 C-terminal domain-containing protein [bacterium]|nr:glycoside hydrolase family 3 C-terminal domain-containing protein [bacterium]
MKKMLLSAALICTIAVWSAFCRSPQKRVEDLLGQMTLEEKIDFIGGTDGYYIRAVPRLGIPKLLMADGPVGVRSRRSATAFPALIGLAASWDTSLAAAYGSAVGMEARSLNTPVMLGPAMNIHRAPMCGRNFEYLGEDPYLAGQTAAHYILGMQKQGVMATAKHYLGNNQEYDRNNISSDMDERTMQEIYLPAFRASVVQGKVAAVMTSYNPVNGVHASQHNGIINGILKGDWKFDGFVMSDWTSVYDAVGAANGGLDLEMPSGKFMNRDSLMTAIESGRVSIQTIDDKVRRILRQEERFGLLDNPDISKGYILDSLRTRKVALDAARAGIVLLKNSGGILPLDAKKIRRIAVIGPNAHPAVTGGGGSSSVRPLHPVSLFDAIIQIAGPDVQVELESGTLANASEPPEFFDQAEFYTIVDGKQVPGFKAEFFTRRRPEGKADAEMLIPILNRVFTDSIPGIPRNNFFARFSGFLKADKTGPYRFVVSSNGGCRLSIDEKPITGSWGSRGVSVRSAVVPLEAGKEYAVSLFFMNRQEQGVIRLGYDTPESYEQKVTELVSRVKKTALAADFVVLSLGFSGETESEGSDRTFQLPPEQERLARDITQSCKNLAVVLNAGGNVDMAGWIDRTPALVHAWYPGQEGNLAVAEILFGITNPCGKLPVSFEKKWEDNATFNSYYDADGDKRVAYSEGLFLGYRHFDTKNIEPLFPFGFGLSFTIFEYGKLKVKSGKFKSSDQVDVSLRIKNTGKREGAEIVQLYVADPVSSVPRPKKELKAYAKVTLKPGESREVKFTLEEEAFQFFSPDKHQWTVEPGDFILMTGSSSRDIRAEKKITLVE